MTKQAQILKERAERLAKVIKTQELDSNLIEVLVFHLAQEKYGIETKYVKEVYPLKEYTPLPCVPAFIYGLINVRRRILSIFDLKAFFGFPSSRKASESKLLILEEGEMEFALLTDGIHSMQKIFLSEIQLSLPTALNDIEQDFIRGITSEKVILLDGKKLLASKQIIIDENVEI
jgi:purine-binding chemotaxis protein CheW